MNEAPPNLDELRFVIYLARMMRKHFERWDQHADMIFAESCIRSARKRYREAKGI